MKKSGIFLLLVVMFMFFSLPFISAQPPQATQVVLNLDSGLNIEAPRIAYLKQNEDFLFSFHVYNITTGQRVDNSSTNCTYELFQHNGTHIYEVENLKFVENEWEVLVKGGNFSRIGEMYYIADCTSVGEGGVIPIHFHVTKTGQELTTEESLLYLILILGVLILFGLSLYFMIATPYSNKIDRKGAVIQITKLKYVKLGLILLTWVLFTWALNVLIGISDNFVSLTMYYGFFGFMFDVMNRLALPLGIIIFVIALFEIWKDVNIQKAISKFGSSN